MALALPFLQAVLKTYIIPNAPLLNFMRALAYGLATAGVVVNATFFGWLLSDESRSFSVMVPALCARMQLKTVRPLAVPRTWRERSKPPRCVVACLHFLRTLMSRPLHVSAPPLRGLLLPSRVAGASSLLASPCSSAARTKKPGAALPRSFCRLRCVLALPGVDITCSLLMRVFSAGAHLPSMQLDCGADRAGADAACRRLASVLRRRSCLHRHHHVRRARLGAAVHAPCFARSAC